MYCPAPQLRATVHRVALAAVLYVPPAQAVHIRSVEAPPLVLTNCPAAQSDHVVHTASFLVAV
jgi:hypothetical protein